MAAHTHVTADGKGPFGPEAPEEKRVGDTPLPEAKLERKEPLATKAVKKSSHRRKLWAVTVRRCEPCRIHSPSSIMHDTITALHESFMNPLYSCLHPDKLGTLSLDSVDSDTDCRFTEDDDMDLHFYHVVWTLGIDNNRSRSEELYVDRFSAWLRNELGIWISKTDMVWTNSEIRVTLLLLKVKLIIHKLRERQNRAIQDKSELEKKQDLEEKKREKEEKKREEKQREERAKQGEKDYIAREQRSRNLIIDAICGGAILVAAGMMFGSSSASRTTK